jgi:Flp pilus assembly protein TadD
MASRFRGLVLASISASVLALAACGTTSDANVTNKAGASRVDTILERAAREAKASGNTVETAALLEQLHTNNPNDPAIATSFGQALREDEQFTKARQVLYPFTQGKTPYPDAVMELAMVQLSLGQYKEAELTARDAVQLDPESGRAYLALGTALDAQNYHEQAEVAFRRGIDKWKGDPAPIMNNLALNLASQNKLDQAIDMLKKAKEISPGRIELERNLRIVTTLKEGADDFLVKQEQNKKQAIAKPALAPVPLVKKQEPKTVTKVIEEKIEPTPKEKTVKKVTQEDIDNKQLEPEKVEPAATPKTNARGSRQNF